MREAERDSSFGLVPGARAELTKTLNQRALLTRRTNEAQTLSTHRTTVYKHFPVSVGGQKQRIRIALCGGKWLLLVRTAFLLGQLHRDAADAGTRAHLTGSATQSFSAARCTCTKYAVDECCVLLREGPMAGTTARERAFRLGEFSCI